MFFFFCVCRGVGEGWCNSCLLVALVLLPRGWCGTGEYILEFIYKIKSKEKIMIVIVPQSPSLPAIERSVLFSIFQMVMSYSFNDLLASFLLLI